MTQQLFTIPDYIIDAGLGWIKSNVLTRRPNQIISRHGDPYIKRYELSRKAVVPVEDNPKYPIGWSGFNYSELENIYVHEFVRSDKDDPHNHPWPNLTVVLSGWYMEEVWSDDGKTSLGTYRRNVGDVVSRPSHVVHAITETAPNCISLFMTGKKEQDWGFFTPSGYIEHADYAANSAN